MKKLFVLFVAVMMAVAGMVIPASAAEHDYPEFPEDDYNYAFVAYREDGTYRLFLVDSAEQPLCDGSVILLGSCFIYECPPWESKWMSLGDFPDMTVFLEDEPVIWASHDVYDYDGNLVVKATSGSVSNSPVLPTVTTADTLTGALKEVTGLLVIALPVVACLFGIRKGIAWLIGLIRAS